MLLRKVATLVVACGVAWCAMSGARVDAAALRHRIAVNHRIVESLGSRLDNTLFAPTKTMLEEGSPAHRILSYVESLHSQLEDRLKRSQETCRLDQEVLSKRAGIATGAAEKAESEVEKNRQCMRVNLKSKSEAAEEIGRLLKTLTPHSVYDDLQKRSDSVSRVMHKYTDVKASRDEKFIDEQKSRDKSVDLVKQVLEILHGYYQEKNMPPPEIPVERSPGLIEVGAAKVAAATGAQAAAARIVASIRSGRKGLALRLLKSAVEAPAPQQNTVAGTIFRQVWNLQHSIANESSAALERHELRANEHREQISSLQADIDTIEGQIREHQAYDQDVRAKITSLQGTVANLTSTLVKCKEQYNIHHGIQSAKMSRASGLEQQAEKNLELCKKEHKHINDEMAIGKFVMEKIHSTVSRLAAQIAHEGATGATGSAAGATGAAH